MEVAALKSYNLSNSENKQLNLALIEAAEKLNDSADKEVVAKIKELIQQGAAVKYKDPVTNRTALHYAAMGGNVEVAKLLLDNGANINEVTQYNQSPLYFALRKGYPNDIDDNIVQNDYYLVNVARIQQANRLKIVNLLINRGANVNLKTKGGSSRSALLEAVDQSDAEVVKVLLKAGADKTYLNKWVKEKYGSLYGFARAKLDSIERNWFIYSSGGSKFELMKYEKGQLERILNLLS